MGMIVKLINGLRDDDQCQQWLWFFMALAFVLGLLASTHGQQFFPDEFRTYFSADMMTALSGKYPPQNADMFIKSVGISAMTQPLYHLLMAPVVALKLFSEGFQVDRGSGLVALIGNQSLFSHYLTGFYLLNVYLVYRLAKTLFKSNLSGLLAMGLYILWPQHLFYIRHILPYLPAETFFLLSGLTLSRAFETKELQMKWLILSGVFWLCQCLVYLGYTHTILFFAGIFLFHRVPISLRLTHFAIFLTPSVLWLVCFEPFTRSVFGKSYVERLIEFAQTVTQGDMGSGWIMPVEYAWSVSPIITIIALATLVWMGYRLSKKPGITPAVVCYGGVGILWLWLTLNSTVLHHSVVYGRSLLPLYLLVILVISRVVGCWLPSEGFQNSTKAQWIFTTGGLAIVVSSIFCITQFLGLNYPLDINSYLMKQAKLQLNGNFLHAQRTPDHSLQAMKGSDGSTIAVTRTMTTQSTEKVTLSCQQFLNPDSPPVRYLILNREFVLPLAGNSPVSEELYKHSLLTFDVPYPMLFLPYQYEAFNRNERKILNTAQPRMQVLKHVCQKIPQ